MRTDLGSALQGSNVRTVLALLVGAAVVGLDLWFSPGNAFGWWRPSLGLAGLLLLLAIGGFDPKSVGLRWQPLPGVRKWINWGLMIGLIVLSFAAVVTFAMWLFDALPPIKSQLRNVDLGDRFYKACIRAPFDEELVYRLAVCVPLLAWMRPWLGTRTAAATTIFVSGAIFAWLHFLYGNPGPDNFIAGFVLSWAYLRSSCLWIPIVFHALGNLFVFGVQWGLLVAGY